VGSKVFGSEVLLESLLESNWMIDFFSKIELKFYLGMIPHFK